MDQFIGGCPQFRLNFRIIPREVCHCTRDCATKEPFHTNLILDEIQDQDTEKTFSANVPYMQGEKSESLKAPTHAANKTRMLGKSDKTNTSPTLAMRPQIGPSNAYERQPRHKTREDRYEYKPNVSTIGSRSRPLKPKVKRNRARRHTMNDEFHAINVTESRLTVSAVFDF